MHSGVVALSLVILAVAPSAAHEPCGLAADRCSDAASALRIAQAAPPVVRPPMPSTRSPALPAPPTIPSRPVQPAPKVRAPVVVPLTQPSTGQGTKPADAAAGEAKQKQARPAGKREYIGAIRARYQQILLGRDFNRRRGEQDRAIEINPNDADAHTYRGGAYTSKKDDDKALPDLDRAIALNPKQGAAFGVRGTLRIEKQQYPEAVADLDRAIELNPNMLVGYLQRAKGYEGLGKKTDALNDYQKVVDGKPFGIGDFLNQAEARKAIDRLSDKDGGCRRTAESSCL